ncbi:hypothetical protein D9757_010177 [Collybiopsis confluens]|uniref:Uncharacterized protein n=1 Tax=Collybiopsis confluens TaxID=2823264 RepID=A0A8H5H0Y3_9AGAR|nr:hypothetical protein D9757_010177 [Collybiopsis confluens]
MSQKLTKQLTMVPTYPAAIRRIMPKDSNWPKYRHKIIPPPGKTTEQAIAPYSIPCLFTTWRRAQHARQVIPHRGLEHYAAGIPDNSRVALTQATESAFNSTECDYMVTRPDSDTGVPGPGLIRHDLTALRQTAEMVSWSDYNVAGDDLLPSVITRNVGSNHFSDRYVDSETEVPLAFDFFRERLGENPDCAIAVALLSWMDDLIDNVAIQFYAYRFLGPEKFIQNLMQYNPHPDWKSRVLLIPVMMPDTLPRLAGVEEESISFDAMLKGAKEWTLGMMGQGFRIAALSSGVTGVGRGVDLMTGTIKDLYGDAVYDTAAQSVFIRDAVLIDHLAWMAAEFPDVPRMASWKLLHAHIPSRRARHYEDRPPWMKRATVGNPFDLSDLIDWSICDAAYLNINCLNKTMTFSFPEGLDNAERNLDDGQVEEEGRLMTLEVD